MSAALRSLLFCSAAFSHAQLSHLAVNMITLCVLLLLLSVAFCRVMILCAPQLIYTAPSDCAIAENR